MSHDPINDHRDLLTPSRSKISSQRLEMPPCCSICLNQLHATPELNATDNRICVIACGHTFHFACVKQWHSTNLQHRLLMGEAISTDISCPNCRKMHPPEAFEIKFGFDDPFLCEKERKEAELIAATIEAKYDEYFRKISDISGINTEILTVEKELANTKKKTHNMS